MKTIIVNVLFFLSFSVIAAEEEVSKSYWISAMKTALPAAFCNSEQYFRQCYKVTAIECEEVAASATRLCLNDLESELPNVLLQPRDGTFWGTKVGECAGIAYDVSLNAKRISNDECDNVLNWQ